MFVTVASLRTPARMCLRDGSQIRASRAHDTYQGLVSGLVFRLGVHRRWCPMVVASLDTLSTDPVPRYYVCNSSYCALSTPRILDRYTGSHDSNQASSLYAFTATTTETVLDVSQSFHPRHSCLC